MSHTLTRNLTKGAIHKGRPHQEGGRGVSQMETDADRGGGELVK